MTMVFAATTFSQLPAGGDQEVKDGIAKLIRSFQTKDVDSIAECFKFPFHRPYPIPVIYSEEEFVHRFEEVFDEEVSEKIRRSLIEKDWTMMGWRGYMLFDGLVWVQYDGKVDGINYLSAKEKQIREDLIAEDKKTIHTDLQAFEAPVLKWETQSVALRIDYLGDEFRLGIWKVGESFSGIPERVIEDGTVVFEGSGGNHYYRFQQDDTVYECWVEVIGGESKYRIGTITIQKQGVEVFHEEANRSY